MPASATGPTEVWERALLAIVVCSLLAQLWRHAALALTDTFKQNWRLFLQAMRSCPWTKVVA
ncbi:MAG: hypothetical protein A3H44_11570 [Gammaproteobacteria bacterium RIFCSPLOWO2_02_FULL_57_10]|nr:MAG: hypothetical protein A3H44_11570 [Gammaproteobacteria bacterium RIFCSPLOWO2_02_FULL_57_10]